VELATHSPLANTRKQKRSRGDCAPSLFKACRQSATGTRTTLRTFLPASLLGI